MAMTQTLTDTDLFRDYWTDGLLDVLAGSALLLTGAGWQSAFGPLAVIQAPLWIVLWRPLRRAFVEPYAGFVRFSLAREQRNTFALKQTLAFGAAALAFLIALSFFAQGRAAGTTLQWLAPGLPALIVAIGLALTSFLTEARRFLAYALALLAAGASAAVFDWDPGLSLAAGGTVVAATGAALFTRFRQASREYEERDRP